MVEEEVQMRLKRTYPPLLKVSMYRLRTYGREQWLATLISCILAGSLVGCVNETQQSGSDSQIIPFALWNRWVYIDSLSTASQTAVDTITVTVISVRKDATGLWWKLENRFNPSIAANEFMLRNDSVFSLQRSESPAGTVPVVSLEYARPPLTDTLRYNSLFGGDVVIEKTLTAMISRNIQVPAATFSTYATVAYQVFPDHYREFLVRGAGVVRIEIRSDSSAFGPASFRSISLNSYALTN